MVMHARKPTRVSDGCNDRRDSQSYQTHKSQPKSQSSSLHRYDKVRDGSSDPTPPYKMLRRSDDSPVSRHADSMGHKAKTSQTLRGKNGTSGSPQENSHNNSSYHGSDSHAAQSKPADRRQDPADDWTEHISSSGKKYYYNCRTEVSQWEKPKDLLEREQRQKDSAKMAANSFPRDMDYRQEALQDKATAKITSDQSSASNSGHSSSSSSSSSQSLNSVPGALGPTPSATSSSSSTVPAPSAVQSQSPALLQDPALLHQLIPALQATLQMNNGSMDMAKINEVLAAAVTQASLRSMLHKLLTAGPSAFNITALLSQVAQHSSQAQQSSQSPVSLTSDASSPRPYVSPRNGTPQSNLMGQKSLLGMPPGVITSSQIRGNISSVKSGQPPLSQTSIEKRPEDPRTLQQRSQEILSTGQNHLCGTGLPHVPSCSTSQAQAGTPVSFTPTLATHFDENLIRHVQGWPAEHTEKQAARLREDIHNMGSLYMSEICTELKNLRSLVRVCEIQATLREQRILFLRQQSKELDKLKNQNSYMV
ncbi:WW domain-containing adapter protein with coiled-coil-like isoform X2 [Myripristis murdjan]|uniref:WW domain-containing adapter protein with coiled-coil-like isoform X2 n=1 Tax=Myripristis murdjan TaxID=586833 RepID=UPI00117604FF|nr:WW domain-containing adapter protein with coiled-coil-like isoform X2 [Myripristis murdjan]